MTIDLSTPPGRAKKFDAGIILGDGWSEDASDETPWWRNGGKSFGHRSPLARKIVTFNLVALGLLVGGILYLNQFEDGLITLREQSLEAQGKMIAKAVSRIAENAADTTIPAEAIDAVIEMTTLSSARGQLFDAKGVLLTDTSFLRPEQEDATSPPEALVLPQQPTAMTEILNEIWVRSERLFSDNTEGSTRALSSEFSNVPAMETIASGAVTKVRNNNSDGQLVVSVTVPVVVGKAVLGALVLSTPGGEIDAIVRGEREQILRVFVLALLSSIALSVVLANTIAKPLRDLAEAAEKGGATTSSRRLNPERIKIPDMTARPDEIGYLSGAMRSMTAALFDRIEANESFAADVAHEIKNPLTSLRSAVETLGYAKSEDDRNKLMAVIQKDVRRLDRLVTDISNASRLDRELVRDEMEEFDLFYLLRNLAEFNSHAAEDRGGKLVHTLPEGETFMMKGLEGRLAQVFVNFISNAISFLPPDGGVVTIRAAAIAGGKKVRISVEDNGPGIPDENLKDVFSRFYSERPGQEFGNHSGLGLSISEQIIEAHGGEIWAENIRAQGAGAGAGFPRLGARFVVELPL